MTRFADFCRSGRWLILIAIACATAAAVPLALRVRTELGAESLYPAGSQAVADYHRVRDTFGGDEVAAVYIEDPNLFSRGKLEALATLHQGLERLPFVQKIDSLLTLPDLRDDGGLISTSPLLAVLPDTPAGIQSVKLRATENPLLAKQFVSEDGTATMILLRLAAAHRDLPPAQIVARIEAVLAPHTGAFQRLFQLGDPFTQDWMRRQLAADQRLILPLALALILCLLSVTQRSLLAGLIPLVTACIAIVWTLALMALFDLPINFLNSILPALIVVIGSTSDVHFIHEFREHLGQGMSGLDALRATMRRLALPLLLTSSTTILGFATTALGELPVLRDFGLAATVGMTARFFISALFLPAALLVALPFLRPRSGGAAADHSWSHAFAKSLVSFLLGHPRLVLTLLAITCAGAILFASQIRAGNDLRSFLRPDSPVRLREGLAMSKLAGMTQLSLTIKADRGEFMEPRALRQIEAIAARLRQLPGVATVTAFTDLLARLNSQLRGGGAKNNRVPDDPNAISQLMLFLAPSEYRAFLTPNYSETCLHLRCEALDTSGTLRLEREIRAILETEEINTNPYIVTGGSLLVASAVDSITQGQVASLGSMILLTFFIVWALFLSPRCGVTTLLVNVFPIAMIFGIMGATGISLNVGTCMVAAITLGIAVDDTLHLLVRFNREAREHKDERLGIEIAIREELPPILTTTLALACGFAVLGLSSFRPVREFGLLSACVMVIGLVTDMVVTPVLFGRTRVVTLWDVLGLRLRQSLLKTSPFLSGLNHWQARKLILASNVVEHRAGESPVSIGDPGDSLFVVLEGQLETSRPVGPGRQVLKYMHPGDVFGEMAFVTRQPRTADVTAITDARLLKISFEELNKLRRLSPYLASRLLYNISRIICERAAAPGAAPARTAPVGIEQVAQESPAQTPSPTA